MAASVQIMEHVDTHDLRQVGGEVRGEGEAESSRSDDTNVRYESWSGLARQLTQFWMAHTARRGDLQVLPGQEKRLDE